MADFQNAREVETDFDDSGDMTKMLQSLALQGSVHFAITKLRKSQVPEQTLSRSCRLLMPSWFVQKHGDKFHQTVILRSGMSTVPCQVRLTVVYTSSGIPEIKLGRGWRDFATYNRLGVGDSVIFELQRLSEFAVHIFRALSSPRKCSADKSELRDDDDDDDSSAGNCSSQRRSEDAAEWTAAKRKIVESRLQTSDQGPELQETILTPSEKLRHSSQSSPELEAPVKPPPISRPDALTDHDRNEYLQQPARESLPSFTQRLVSYNVQDAVGNTCGAVFEVPWSFVMAHSVHLQVAHVHLQGTGEESPVRAVTSTYFHRSGVEKGPGHPLVWWGWGDFVRENALQAGQAFQFTLAADSFFQVREVQL